jgi:hypothetical protein
MRLAFFDPGPLDYTVLTPTKLPLGGTESAALAARGHNVTFINHTTTPGLYGGVDCVSIKTLEASTLNDY